MKKSILKLLLFVLAIFVFVATTKFASYNSIIKNPSFKPFFQYTISDSSCYFIGSSRIRESFDEKLMKQKIPSETFHNLGINALSMNYGLILANKIISKTNNNIIFIELSRFKPYRSPRCHDIFSYSDIGQGLEIYFNSLNKKSFQEIKTFITDIGEFTINIFSLKEDLGILIDSNNGITNLANSKIETAYVGDTNSINYLNPSDIDSISKTEKQIKSCFREILKTIAEGEKKKTRVIFLVPVSFSSAEEKKELLPLFNSIPAKNKLIYSEKFLKEICQTKNLYDDIHFNTNGSFVFSNELAIEIKKLIDK